MTVRQIGCGLGTVVDLVAAVAVEAMGKLDALAPGSTVGGPP